MCIKFGGERVIIMLGMKGSGNKTSYYIVLLYMFAGKRIIILLGMDGTQPILHVKV